MKNIKQQYSFAFDVDGTITKNPQLFNFMMRVLKEQMATVYVLTGNGNNYMPREKRIAQLEKLGITEDCYDELLIAYGKGEEAVKEVAKEKGRICKEKGIDVLIDDMHSYCEQVKKQCKDGTLTFRVK